MSIAFIVTVLLIGAGVALVIARKSRRSVERTQAPPASMAAPASGPNSSNHVYDKAKYHYDSVVELGLPEEHAYHHTTFFLSWLVKRGLLSPLVEEEGQADLERYRSGQLTINQLYESWDCCLISDMLSDEGNAFARSYFDFATGQYLEDHKRHLQRGLKSEYQVTYTAENEAAMHRVIDQRFEEWRRT